MNKPAHTKHAMQACIEACSRCHQVCLQTAMNYCLNTGGTLSSDDELCRDLPDIGQLSAQWLSFSASSLRGLRRNLRGMRGELREDRRYG
ncbi:hypothetical protein [Methylobacter tundripaludum]|uniref:Four-helix bundle copper-binding protein n=1 Tax=Methylobacter tundripaludum (strain ATCC BAA-1195 / DSM 17260 / SV96) TaxID=697282 RepID=G3IU00_METTV|nr:hypothetical protein [Methylobacter tundripaludum]EGW21483.1 hypothetical protein Mettu_0247 [Methylobacter tundripaludum SV96]